MRHHEGDAALVRPARCASGARRARGRRVSLGNRLPRPRLRRTVQRAEAGFVYAVINAGCAIDPQELATILINDRDHVDYIQSLLEDLKGRGLVLEQDGRYSLPGSHTIPFADEPALEAVFYDIQQVQLQENVPRTPFSAKAGRPASPSIGGNSIRSILTGVRQPTRMPSMATGRPRRSPAIAATLLSTNPLSARVGASSTSSATSPKNESAAIAIRRRQRLLPGGFPDGES